MGVGCTMIARAARRERMSRVKTLVVTNIESRPFPPDFDAHHGPETGRAGGYKFRNPWPSFVQMAGLFTFLRARLRGEITPPPSIPSPVSIPSPSSSTSSSPPSTTSSTQKLDWSTGDKSKIKSIWLGHASCYVELPCSTNHERGLRVLFDPVFSERCSPVSWAGPKRHSPSPIDLSILSLAPEARTKSSSNPLKAATGNAEQDDSRGEVLPEIDVVCISHNHYDHLDLPTITALHSYFGDTVHFCVPLGLGGWMRSIGIQDDRITELDWWQDILVEATTITTSSRIDGIDGDRKEVNKARIGLLPAQHFANRGIFDAGKTLWGSYSLDSLSHPEKKVWFAGDTGRRSIPSEIEQNLPLLSSSLSPDVQSGTDIGTALSKTQQEAIEALNALPVCPAHAQIGNLRGPFEFAMIPIGAYKPRYLMSPVHVDPGEAIEIFREVKARKAVGIHWGTFELSAEEVEAPKVALRRIAKEREVEGFETWNIGERREI